MGSSAKALKRRRVEAAREQASRIFGNADAAREWLERECQALGFVRPIDLLGDEEGLARVMTVLIRIERGVYT